MCRKFQVILVRHGETSYNKKRIIQGQLDIPLNEAGKAQALAAGELLSNTKFSFAYCSDLKRASLTCELLLSKNVAYAAKQSVFSITHDARLRERTFGCMEGKSVTELINATKEAKTSMLHYVAEGGETLEELKNRARNFFISLCEKVETDYSSERHDQSDVTVLLVSHGGFIKSLFSVWIENHGCSDGDCHNQSYNVIVGNASYSCVTVKLNGSGSSSGDSEKKSIPSYGVTCTSFNVFPIIKTSSE